MDQKMNSEVEHLNKMLKVLNDTRQNIYCMDKSFHNIRNALEEHSSVESLETAYENSKLRMIRVSSIHSNTRPIIY